MKAWTVAGSRASISACWRASTAASPVSSGVNFIAPSDQLGERLAFALRHLEAERLRDGGRDVQCPDQAFRSRALRHARSERDEPDLAARFVAAAMVGEAVAGDVAVAPHLGHDD